MYAFIYHWDTKDGEIIIFCIDENKRTLCLRVDNFFPSFYVDLPESNSNGEHLEWNEDQINAVKKTLQLKLFRVNTPITEPEIKRGKTLYYADNKERSFLYYTFEHSYNFSKWNNITKKTSFYVNGVGLINIKIHEINIQPHLKFTCEKDIPMSGWIELLDYNKPAELISTCNREYMVRDLRSVDIQSTPYPVMMCFDIEVYSNNPNRFPDPYVLTDCIFQISCVFWSQKNSKEDKYLITLGDVDEQIVQQGDEVCIICCATESELMIEFASLIKDYNPSIITGWNILGFDLSFLMGRAEILGLTFLSQLGMLKNHECSKKEENFHSSAYGDQKFVYYDWSGRIILDLMVYASREIKAENYKLATISSMFLHTSKDPLTHKDIFRAYETGVRDMSQDGYHLLSECGHYCMVDSVLVKKLFDVFDIWIGVTEMSMVCNVPASYLYTKGQQIKVFSQVYRYCYNNGIVIDSDVYQAGADERYQGAYVKEPEPGIYRYVVPFDFKSLYPTIIVSYNIDYHTFVPNDCTTIADEECHVIEWEEDQEFNVFECKKCKKELQVRRTHDDKKWMHLLDTYTYHCTFCEQEHALTYEDALKIPNVKIEKNKVQLQKINRKESYKYRFLKGPKGVLPTIITNLLDARARVRKSIKLQTDADYKLILDKRQLSYKVSANSMYGAMGVGSRGLLPLMPGAMCVTAIGRKSLHFAAQYLVDTYGVKWIYSDTDSTYVQFPNTPPSEIWGVARKIERDLLEKKIFPDPMMLEFENAIYDPFFILSKKRYMWKYYKEDGSRPDEIGTKGVVLSRRGMSVFMKEIYEHTVRSIFDLREKNDVLYDIIQYLNACCSHSMDMSKFVVTKKLGNIDSYKNPPPHVDLALRMQKRGCRVEVGQRLEYIVVRRGFKITKNAITKVSGNIEDVEYRQKYNVPINYLYYVHLLCNQLDEVIKTTLKEEDFMMKQFLWRVNKSKLLYQLKCLFRAKYVLVDE